MTGTAAPAAGSQRPAWFGPIRAIAQVTLLEVIRQRLGWLAVAGMVALLVAIPGLEAPSLTDRRRLAVALITGVIGFITVLLAILLPPALLARDREDKVALLLFSKPLGPAAYLLGRFSAFALLLAGTALALALVGSLAIRLRLGVWPDPQELVIPTAWERIELDQPQAIAGDGRPILLQGSLHLGQGQGVRCRCTGLKPGSESDLALLVRLGVNGSQNGLTISRTRIAVAALDGQGERLPLPLADDSPYGRIDDQNTNGLVYEVRDQQGRHGDLSRDYLRLRLPSGSIAADGSLRLQLERRQAAAAVILEREGSILVARPAGTLTGELAMAALIQAAQAALLAAAATAGATFAGPGTVLLACLVLFFGTQAAWAVRDGLNDAYLPRALMRWSELILAVLPDFSRFDPEGDLAVGHHLGLSRLLDVCRLAGAWIALFLAGAWALLRRGRILDARPGT